MTFGLWASKVSKSSSDSSGYGSFTTTNIQGKGMTHISFILALIAVQKGSDIGVKSLYAQQYTLYECQCLRANKVPKPNFCPRSDAIRRLDEIIQHLQ
jgi:hypothetical protein